MFDASSLRVISNIGVRGGVNVRFEVREMPLITKLKFVGLQHVTEEELLAVLREQKVEVEANSPYHPERVLRVRQVITDYLVKRRGFVDARVNIAEDDVTATTLIVCFVIHEMPDDDQVD